MSDQKASASSRIMTALVGAGAAFAARKLLSFGWTKIMGKEPPQHPEDPQVALSEALIWGVVLGRRAHRPAASDEGHDASAAGRRRTARLDRSTALIAALVSPRHCSHRGTVLTAAPL